MRHIRTSVISIGLQNIHCFELSVFGLTVQSRIMRGNHRTAGCYVLVWFQFFLWAMGFEAKFVTPRNWIHPRGQFLQPLRVQFASTRKSANAISFCIEWQTNASRNLPQTGLVIHTLNLFQMGLLGQCCRVRLPFPGLGPPTNSAVQNL